MNGQRLPPAFGIVGSSRVLVVATALVVLVAGLLLLGRRSADHEDEDERTERPVESFDLSKLHRYPDS